jgi:hypothetical protein
MLGLFSATALVATAGAPNEIPVSAAIPHTVKAGKTVNAKVVFKVPSGFHIYAPGYSGVGVGVTFDLGKTAGITLGKATASGNGELVGNVAMTVPVKVAKTVHGKRSLALTTTYQECNDRICYPPATATLHLTINVN